MNKVMLQGNVGSDIKNWSKSDDKKTFCKFSIATTEEFTSKEGEKKQVTDWHNVVCFAKLADELISKVKKGEKIYVEGKIKTRSYEVEGVKKYTTEIVMEKFKKTSVPLSDNILDDEIPF